MPEQKKYPEPVEALLLILAVFAFFIVLTLLISLLSGAGLQSPGSVSESSRYIVLFGSSLFLIIPLYYAHIKKYPVKKVFRFKAVSWRVVVLSLVIGISVGVLSDELDRIINLFFPVPAWITEITRPLIVKSDLDWLWIIAGAVLITGFAEEALFRGFLQTSLENKGNVNRAVVLSSLTWTLIHSNPYWAISIFITGIIFGYLSWRSESILPSFIAHGSNNFLAILFINLDASEMQHVQSWYEMGAHVSPAVLLISAFLLVWAIRKMSALYQNPQN